MTIQGFVHPFLDIIVKNYPVFLTVSSHEPCWKRLKEILRFKLWYREKSGSNSLAGKCLSIQGSQCFLAIPRRFKFNKCLKGKESEAIRTVWVPCQKYGTESGCSNLQLGCIGHNPWCAAVPHYCHCQSE